MSHDSVYLNELEVHPDYMDTEERRRRSVRIRFVADARAASEVVFDLAHKIEALGQDVAFRRAQRDENNFRFSHSGCAIDIGVEASHEVSVLLLFYAGFCLRIGRRSMGRSVSSP